MYSLPNIEAVHFPIEHKKVFRCTICGAVCEISDFEMAAMKTFEFNHECNSIEQGIQVKFLEK